MAISCAFAIMRPRRVTPLCDSCGRRFFRYGNREPGGLCPTCRVAKASPEQRRRRAIQGFIIIAALLLAMSSVLAYPFVGSAKGAFGGLAFPMIAGGLFVFLVVVCAAGLVLRYLIRMRQMSDPAYALSVARACGHDHGRETKLGPVSVHAFGADAPISMLNAQREISRSRFESLVGEPLEDDRPLRVFVFGKRDSFDAFFRWAFLYTSNLDGMFVPWSTATIALTTEFPAHRLADLERRTRLLFAYSSLDSYRRGPSPMWIQTGIANVIASGGDEMEAARLNRRVLAALSRTGRSNRGVL